MRVYFLIGAILFWNFYQACFTLDTSDEDEEIWSLTQEITTTEYPEESWKEVEAEAIELYQNFTDSIFRVLSDLGENNTNTDGGNSDDEDGSIASLLGLAYILATTKEQRWPLAYPIFAPTILKTQDQDVLDSLDVVLADLQRTLSISNILFIESGHNAKVGSRALLEVMEVDFEEDDVTIPVINEKIFNYSGGCVNLNYIQEGVLLPSSTVAMSINVIQASLDWSTPLTCAGLKLFHGRELASMLEFRGDVRYTEDDEGVELMLNFKDSKSGLALRMPKDMHDDRSVANIEYLPTVKPRPAIVQFPELQFTLRSSYELDEETNCHFKKEPYLLQVLDVLTFVSLNSDYFRVVSVSGAQILNVRQFEEEMQNQTETMGNRDIPKNEGKDQAMNHNNTYYYNNYYYRPQSDDPLESLPDIEYTDTDDSHNSHENSSNPQESTRMESNNITNNRSNNNMINKNNQPNNPLDHNGDNKTGTTEKLIIFDRPFTWMFFDDYDVPIVAGVVTSLAAPEEAIPPALSFLGTDGQKMSPFLKCFPSQDGDSHAGDLTSGVSP